MDTREELQRRKYKAVILLMLAPVLFFYSVSASAAWNWPWTDNTQEIITGLRAEFNIDYGDATDADLQTFLKIDRNKTFVKAVVEQLQYGEQIESFISTGSTHKLSNIGKETIRYLANTTVLGVLNWAVQSSTLLSFLLETTSTLATISHGVNIYLKFCDVLSLKERRFLFQEYFDLRDAKRPSASFAEINRYYGSIVELVIRLGKGLGGTGPVTAQDKKQLATYFEFCYQSWKLATSQDRRKAITDYILDAVAPQPVRTYSISGRVTSRSGGVPGVTVTMEESPFRKISTAPDTNGQYAFRGLQNGTYTVSPSKAGYLFAPPSRQVTIFYRDITGQDFTVSGSGVAPQPGRLTLRIDGGASSKKQQLDTFKFTGLGFTPNSYVRQYFILLGGSLRNPQRGQTIRTLSNGTISWDFTPQCTSPVGRYTVWVADLNNPEKDKSNYVYETITRNSSCSQTPTPSPQPSPLPTLPPTATVLVMDVSGSMGWRWKGGVKIESAKKAALEFIEQVTHETQTRGGQHQIGVVAFSDGARLLLPLTSDYNRARQVVISLHATNATNLGAGLTTALSEFNKTRSNAQRFIILLSDGNTNTGLNRDQILRGPVVEAFRKHICIHAVAFGDTGDVDADFLRKIGIGSGCGSYSHAETAFELFSTYLKLRHKSLGQVVGEYSSIGKRVTILPGVPISLGTVLIGSGKRELHYTLAWSEQGRLQIRLKDPSGRLVSTSYPRVQIYTTDQFAHLTLLSPKSGAWTIEAAAGTSMPNGTEYYAVLSTRPGGIAIPLPLPVFTIGDRTFGLPSGLPTWLLVTISVTLIALLLYHEFVVK